MSRRDADAAADRRELILALLEAQPYTTTDLAAVVRLRGCAMHSALRALVREGVVTRLADWRWTVETTTPDAPAPIELPPVRQAESVSKRPRPSGRPAKAPPGRPTTIWSPRHVVAAETAPLAPDSGPLTRVIDGVEYEIAWNGCGPIPRPGDDGRSTGNSSLTPAIEGQVFTRAAW